MTDSSYIEKICRLCLSSSQETTDLFEENQILHKIMTCFSIEILNERCFPPKICENCMNKIDEIYDFRCKITESDTLLHQHLHKGDNELEKFYLRLNGEIDIKLEQPDVLDIKNSLELKVDDDIECKSDDLKDADIYNALDYQSDNDMDSTSEEKVTDNQDTATTQTKEDAESCHMQKYSCLTCFKNFKSHNGLLSHYNNDHLLKPNCDDVKENYQIVSSDNKLMYRCNMCDKEYRTKWYVVRHIYFVHTDVRPFICKICGRTYKTASEIIRHSRAHNGTQFFCRHQCGFSTVYRGALKEHEKRHKKTDSKYKCDKCGRGFEVKTWFLQHQNIHAGLKPFKCEICGATFHMHRYLTAHRSSAHPQSSNVRRYVCVHCTLPCDSRTALIKHLKEHGIESSFLCDICGKTLPTADLLKFHKRMHLGIKPFSCSICNKSFHKKYNLKTHQSTHTGERSHTCIKCGKNYGYRSALLRHMRSHADDPLKCDRCSKSFDSRNQFTVHKKLCI